MNTSESLKLIRSDFPTYARLNLKIIDKDGKLIPLLLNRMQRILWSIILTLIEQKRPVRIYLIKARQLGSTTFFSAILYWLSTINKNKRVIGIAQDDEAAANLNLRWQNYYFNSLPELRPRFRKMNPKMIHYATPLKDIKKGEVLDSGLDSMLVVKTADSPQLGRSYTYNGALLTEFCIWPNLGIDVKERMIALKQAIPRRPNTAIFIESTAQGENYGKKFWDDELNGFEKVFVSWLAEDEYRKSLPYAKYFELSELSDSRYGDEVLEKKRIVVELGKWYPIEQFDDSYPQFKHCLNTEGKAVYERWLNHESYCRIAWRRSVIDEECEGDKDAFKQEYPTTIDDAFSVSSKSVFGAINILEAKEFARANAPRCYRFSYRQPIDVKKAIIRDVFLPFSKGSIRIYEPPVQGVQYVCASDSSMGVPGGDDSSFVILKVDLGSGKLVEVGSYNDKIEATEFAGMLYLVCSWYNNALLGIERNHKAGFATLEILRKQLKYSRLYWHKDPIEPKYNQVQWGWLTSEVTRQVMIRDGISWFQKKYLVIYSQEILEQMSTFCENLKTGKIEATAGNHDDLVIALLISAQLTKQIHIRGDAPVDNKLPYLSLGWFVSKLDRERGIRNAYTTRRKFAKRKTIRYA